MKICCNREQIGDGIFFTSIINKTKKTNGVVIHLVTELSSDTASLNAVIPYVISDSSSDYPTITALNKRLSELYGASVRGSVGKRGDNQVVTLSASCINDRYTFDGEKITSKLTDVLLGCLLSPCVENGGFAHDDFELKKRELIDDIEAEINDKRSYAFKCAGSVIYENEPCSVSAKGEKNEAEQITATAAYTRYKELLKTAHIEIIYVGADEPDEIKSKLVSKLNLLERSYVNTVKTDLSPIKSEVRSVIDRHDVVQSKMVMAFKSEIQNEPAFKLMNAVFGGTPFSKLFLNVREKLSLCYYCSSGYNDRKGVLYVDSGVEHGNIKKAEDEIVNQLDYVSKGEFTDSEINEARLAIINSLRTINDSPNAIAEWYFNQAMNGTMLSPEDKIKLLNEVTKEDIIEVAKSLKLDTVYVLTGKESAAN